MFGARHRQAPKDNLLTNPTLIEAFGGNTSGYWSSPARAGTVHEVVPDDAEEVPRVFSMKETSGSFGASSSCLPTTQAPWPMGASSGTGWGNNLMLHPTPTQDSTLGGLGTGQVASGNPCWVTVFGFPGRAAAAVRQQLEAVCGPIVEVCHGEGNFMHICFVSSQAATACLALNGQLLLGKIMVGCIPCTHAALLAVGETDQQESLQRTATYSNGGQFLPPGPGRPEVRRSGFLWRLLDQLFDL